MVSDSDMACVGDKEICKQLKAYVDSTGSIVRDFRTGVLSKDEVMKIIAEEEQLEDGFKPGEQSLLVGFSLLGEYDIVKLLWDKGLRPTVPREGDCTVLHSAVRTIPTIEPKEAERAKLLRLFLSAKETHGHCMPIDQRNMSGWTALKIATRLKLEQCVEVLLQHGANPVVKDEEEYFPLHNSVGNPSIIKMLLNANPANINARDADGNTALMLSLERGAVESSLTLLERGADPNISNREG